MGEATEQAEKANEDSQLEGLKVLPPQDVKQIGAHVKTMKSPARLA